MDETVNIGPVELVVLAFPGAAVDPATIAALQEVVARGYVTLLDLVYLHKDESGDVTQIDVDENLHDVGLEVLSIEARALISDEDLEVIRDSLDPGSSAAIIVYEQTWARSVAASVRAAGGEVALHLQVPRDVIVAAVEAAL